MEVHELHDLLKGDIGEIKTDVKSLCKLSTDHEYRIKGLEDSKRNVVRVCWTFVSVSIAQIVLFIRSKI
jgi:hypothetical protein